MNQSQPLLILGSARHESTTRAFAQQLFGPLPHTVLDLLAHTVLPYNYQHDYPPEDEFPALIEQLLRHEVVVFATPVYWYAMSGTLKIFFDRLTDLVTVRKDLGRRLAGKTVLLVATGADEALPPGFVVPFERTAAYLKMRFAGEFYYSTKTPLWASVTYLQPEWQAALSSLRPE